MGDRIRIAVQLIDTETGNHVWAEKFDRPADDIFSVQDEVMRTVVSALVGRMQASDVGRALALNPTNQWNTADMGGLMMYLGKPDEALDWLRRAREIDPYFTTSWYWRCLGLSHMLLQQYAQGLEILERASARTFRISALMAGARSRSRAPNMPRNKHNPC